MHWHQSSALGSPRHSSDSAVTLPRPPTTQVLLSPIARTARDRPTLRLGQAAQDKTSGRRRTIEWKRTNCGCVTLHFHRSNATFVRIVRNVEFEGDSLLWLEVLGMRSWFPKVRRRATWRMHEKEREAPHQHPRPPQMLSPLPTKKLSKEGGVTVAMPISAGACVAQLLWISGRRGIVEM